MTGFHDTRGKPTYLLLLLFLIQYSIFLCLNSIKVVGFHLLNHKKQEFTNWYLEASKDVSLSLDFCGVSL